MDKIHLPKQFSTISVLFTSTRSSLSSSPGRRTSVNSVLSSTERISSGRRLSDISLVSTERLGYGKETKSSFVNNNYLAKRETMFSPIHEHSEEDLDTDAEVKETALDPVELTIHLTLNMKEINVVLEPRPETET